VYFLHKFYDHKEGKRKRERGSLVYGTNSISPRKRGRERHKEKEKGAIECGVREVCKVGNGL
jgi:hypothetical protein